MTRKRLTLLALLMVFAFTAPAQDQIQFNDLQQKSIKASLDTKYPGVDYNSVRWELNSEGYFDGLFVYNDRELIATFDQDGTWRESAEQIQLQELPENLQGSINETMVQSITRVESRDDEILYRINFHGRQARWFDAEGNEVERY